MNRKKSSFYGVPTNNIILSVKHTLDGKEIYSFNPDFIKLCKYALDNNDLGRMNKEQQKFFKEYIDAMEKLDINTTEPVANIFKQFDLFLGS